MKARKRAQKGGKNPKHCAEITKSLTHKGLTQWFIKCVLGGGARDPATLPEAPQ